MQNKTTKGGKHTHEMKNEKEIVWCPRICDQILNGACKKKKIKCRTATQHRSEMHFTIALSFKKAGEWKYSMAEISACKSEIADRPYLFSSIRINLHADTRKIMLHRISKIEVACVSIWDQFQS